MGLATRLAKSVVHSLLVPGGLGLAVPWGIARWGSPPLVAPVPALVVPAWILIGVGILGYLWCAWDFVTRGQGTPNPLDPPTRLVVAGPYRVVRNPMYSAYLLTQVGAVALHPSVPMLAWLGGGLAFVLGFVLLYEEPALTRRFGHAYDTYRTTTPRFLPWPRPGGR